MRKQPPSSSPASGRGKKAASSSATPPNPKSSSSAVSSSGKSRAGKKSSASKAKKEKAADAFKGKNRLLLQMLASEDDDEHQETAPAASSYTIRSHEDGDSDAMSLQYDDEDDEDDEEDASDEDDDGESAVPPSSFAVVGLAEAECKENVNECSPRDSSGSPSPPPREKKVKKPGIIFLSSIPPGFNVSVTTSFFSKFGKVGRVFLQPDPKEKARNKDKLARNFTEGWIEFVSKRLAKNVAANLNNSPVGGKKRSKAHDVLWNIKYLPRFKWTHLTERLAYEKHSHQQKMRAEISQAKREADFFKANVEKSKRLNRKRKQQSKKLAEPGAAGAVDETEAGAPASAAAAHRAYEFRQKETDDAIRKRKRAPASAVSDDVEEGPSRQKSAKQSASASASKSKGKRQNKSKGKGKMSPSKRAAAGGQGSSSGRSNLLMNVFAGGSDNE